MLAYAASFWLSIQQINNERKTMKVEINPELIYSLLEAIKLPHVTVMVGMLGVLLVFGLIFITYVKANKE